MCVPQIRNKQGVRIAPQTVDQAAVIVVVRRQIGCRVDQLVRAIMAADVSLHGVVLLALIITTTDIRVILHLRASIIEATLRAIVAAVTATGAATTDPILEVLVVAATMQVALEAAEDQIGATEAETIDTSISAAATATGAVTVSGVAKETGAATAVKVI